MRIVILGSPGSGKKTQASLLAEKYQLTILTVSDLVTHAQAEQSERGEQLRLMLQRGQSPAEEVILELLQDRISQPDMRNGFILDGFPRNLLQALTLDEVLAELSLPIDFVLLFEIETDALMERLVGRRTCRSCGAVYNVYTHPTVVEDVCDLCGGRLHQRADDTEDTVSSRLHVFDHLTGPLLSHYGKQEKVLRVDGEGDRDQVFERTCLTVDDFLSGSPVPEGAAKAEVAETPGAYVRKGDAPETGEATEQQPASSEEEVPAPKPSPGAGKRSAKQPVSKKAAAKKTAPKKAAPKQPDTKKSASKKSAPKKAAGTKSKATTESRGIASQAKGVKKPTTKKKVTKKTAKKAGTAKATKRAVGKKKAAAVRKSSRKQATAKKTTKKKVAKKKVVSKTAVRAAASKKKSPSASKKKVVKKSPVKKASSKRPLTKKKVSKKKETKKAPAKRVGTNKAASKKTPAKKKPASRPANKKLAKKTAGKPTGKKKIAKKTASNKKKATKKGAKSASRRR